MGFEPPTLSADLNRMGLKLTEDLGPGEIQERYFSGRTDGYHAFEQVHFATAMVV